jgi:chorismate mutase/prephenate dehydratase
MDIKTLRERIDKVDDEITRLFGERMDVSRLVAEYKQENKLPVFDRGREGKFSPV